MLLNTCPNANASAFNRTHLTVPPVPGVLTMYEFFNVERCLYTAEGQRRYLNQDERERFKRTAAHAPAEVESLCLTLLYTGCRVSEALALTRRSIEIHSPRIAVRSLKKRGVVHVRQMPVPSALIEKIIAIHPLTADPAARLWSMHRMTAWRKIKAVMHEASINGIQATPRGLRHSYGVHAISRGVPLNMIQRWMGHANMKTTAIYTNAIGVEEQRIAERMWG